jgi:hypothetical protein
MHAGDAVMTFKQIKNSLVGSLSLVLSLFAAGVATAYTDVTPVEEQVLDTISDYETSGPDILTPIFREIGYTPTSSSWKSFPAIRKLQALYASAEAGSPGGGSRAIAAVAYMLSKKYDSIRNSPSITAFVRGHNINSPNTFGQASPTLSRTAPDAHSVIKKLAPVAEGNLGGLYKVLTSDFGLASGRAYAILATSDNATAALVTGFSEVPEEQQRIRLNHLINRAKKTYPLLAQDKAIIKYEEPEKTAIAKMLEELKGAGEKPKPSFWNEEVMCSCGGRPIGMRPAWLCIPGTPCGIKIK